MKKLELNGGQKLTKEQMRKIGGGTDQCCIITCYNDDGELGTFGAGNSCSPIVEKCDTQYPDGNTTWGDCQCGDC